MNCLFWSVIVIKRRQPEQQSCRPPPNGLSHHLTGCLLAAGTLSEPAAQKNRERERNSRHLTTEMMLAVLPLSLNFERPTSKHYDSPNVIISVSQLTRLHSVPQNLRLISLTLHNYVFSVHQLSQTTETSYHHYLQLFFIFSLSFFVFWLSLQLSKM